MSSERQAQNSCAFLCSQDGGLLPISNCRIQQRRIGARGGAGKERGLRSCRTVRRIGGHDERGRSGSAEVPGRQLRLGQRDARGVGPGLGGPGVGVGGAGVAVGTGGCVAVGSGVAVGTEVAVGIGDGVAVGSGGGVAFGSAMYHSGASDTAHRAGLSSSCVCVSRSTTSRVHPGSS